MKTADSAKSIEVWQLSQQTVSKKFSISDIEKHKVRPELETQTIRCKGNRITSKPSEKAPESC